MDDPFDRLYEVVSDNGTRIAGPNTLDECLVYTDDYYETCEYSPEPSDDGRPVSVIVGGVVVAQIIPI